MNIRSAITPKSALLGGLLFAMGVPALAAPITGTLGFNGTGALFTNTVGGVSFIDFRNPPGLGYGAITVANRSVGSSFETLLDSGDGGSILDLNTTAVPPATNVEIDNFLLFNDISEINFQLTMLPLATCAPGVLCVGPFQLVQNNDNVSVSMNIRGLIKNGNPSETTRFTGLITAQFLDTTVLAVRNAAGTPGGVVASSFGGSLTASLISEVPEPESITLISIGVLAMLLGGLRAKHKTEQDS